MIASICCGNNILLTSQGSGIHWIIRQVFLELSFAFFAFSAAGRNKIFCVLRKPTFIMSRITYHNILSGRKISLCRRAARAPSLAAIQQDGAGLSGPVLSAVSPQAKNATSTNKYSSPNIGTLIIYFIHSRRIKQTKDKIHRRVALRDYLLRQSYLDQHCIESSTSEQVNSYRQAVSSAFS